MGIYNLGLRVGRLSERVINSINPESQSTLELLRSDKFQFYLDDLEKISKALADLDYNTPESILKYFEEDILKLESKIESERGCELRKEVLVEIDNKDTETVE